MKHLASDTRGQAQLLAALVIGVTVLSGAILSLDWAHKNKIHSVHATRRAEMKSVLDLAVKHAAQIFVSEAGCDPASLNDKLNHLQMDGTIDTAGPATRRQMNIAANGNTFLVSFGLPIRLTWTGATADPTIAPHPTTGNLAMNRGVSQDATITVWTTHNSGRNSAFGPGFSHQRVIQSATLINTCSYRCATVNSTDCPVAADPAIAYHSVLSPSTFPGVGVAPNSPAATWNRRCFDPAGGAARYLGDFESTASAPGPNLRISVSDLLLFRNYIRSGDWSGAGTSATTVTYVGISGALPCGDLNGDAQVNEVDLHILEKVMRGYLYWLPTHTLPPPR